MKLYIQQNRKGFALSIVLWIVAALLFGVATIAQLSKDSINLTKDVDRKLKTHLMAQDVFELFKFYAMTADFDNISLLNSHMKATPYKFPSRLIVDGRDYQLSKDVNISIKDTSMMLNVLTSSGYLISSMVTKPSQTQLRYTIEDSIKDWLDKDDFVSLNGAESSYYKDKKFKIANENAIQDPSELRLINGLDRVPKKQWMKFKKRLFYGDLVDTNFALIDAKYLSSSLKIDLSYAKELIEIRNNNLKKYMNILRSIKTFDQESMWFAISKEFLISIKVSNGKVKSILHVLIHFKPTDDKPYTIINYLIV